MLPEWMKDNEHLHKGHRPELQSAAECFKSIFRIHTETGNIWTHMIGFFAFLVVTIVFYVKPFCDNCRYAAKTSYIFSDLKRELLTFICPPDKSMIFYSSGPANIWLLTPSLSTRA